MEQIMGMLKTMLTNNQEQMLPKMDVNTKTMQEDMNTNQAELKSAIAQIESRPQWR
jgi:hypothetical protein